MSNDNLLEYRLAQAESRLIEITRELEEFKEREEQDRRQQLMWGIAALGLATSTLASIIWSFRGVIFK